MATQNADDRSKPIAATQGGTSSATYTTGDILYASSANTLSKLGIGSTAEILTVASGIPDWAPKFSGSPITGNGVVYTSAGEWAALDASKYSLFFDDFIYSSFSSWSAQWPWYRGVTGSGTQSIPVTSIVGHPGIMQLETGTTSTGQAGVHRADYIATGSDFIRFETLVRFPNLSTSSQEFYAYIGIHDALAGITTVTDGFYFEYDRGNSVNWRGCCTAAAATTRTTGTDVAVASNTWQHLMFEMNAAGTSCTFYVDGTSIGSVTANIPASAYMIAAYIKKMAGSTERTCQIDFIKYYSEFGTDRF